MFQTWATNVMLTLLVSVALILLYLVYVGLRNPVLVKIGLRNIPRRPAQSVLIVIGLTLSTIIIVSSLSTGDTLTYSVRAQAVQSYGPIDQIVAPPLLSLLVTLADQTESFDQAAAENEQVAELQRLTEGGLISLLAVLEGGLPGITTQRLDELKQDVAQEPLIDAVAGSIIFPTIIRNTTTGQGEPLGFIFAVDEDYDLQFGLVSVDGTPVAMDDLQTGVGNIFGQAANLFGFVEDVGARLGLGDVRISDVALATAAVGAALTSGTVTEGGIDLAELSLSLETLRGLGIDTTFLEEQGLTEISLAELGITPDLLESVGVTTTTVNLGDVTAAVGIDTTGAQTVTNQVLAALNLNTLGRELDRVLAQVGLQLRQGDVYLSRMGAEQLDARVGDVLEVYIGPLPLPFRVKAIVDQAGPMSAFAPVVMLRLDEAQQLLFMRGRVNNILISNQGDPMQGIAQTNAVSARLRVLALDPTLVAQAAAILNRPAVRAALVANADSFAVEFGEEFDGPEALRPMFESVAGFVASGYDVDDLLAALDQPDNAQAVREALSTLNLRNWLLQLELPAADQAELEAVLSRLNQFDVLDPLSKQSVVTAAELGGAVFSTVFAIFGILSIIAAVLLIFLIFVMMAAERRAEMGMARAIGVQRGHLVQMFVTEGMVYDLLAAALGVVLGLGISYAMVGFLGDLFNRAAEQISGQSGIFRVRFFAAPTSLVIAYCLGVLFTFIVVTLSSWRVSRLNIVAAIRDLDEPPGMGRTTRMGRLGLFLLGPLLMAGGIWLIQYGLQNGIGLIQAGAALTLVGGAFLLGRLLEWRGLRAGSVQRGVYTLIGVGLIVIWALPWESWYALESARGRVTDVWFLLNFVLGAPLLILGAILVVMFNADGLAWATTRVFSIGALTPVLRTAIAYPLSSRFRTGMTMLLFAMIITTVTLMSVVINATETLIAPDSERFAGFEIGVYPGLLSFFDPLEDLEAEAPTKPDYPAADIAAVGAVTRQEFIAVQSALPGAPSNGERDARIVGVNGGYLTQAATVYTFRARAAEFTSDATVWDALRTREDVAVITRDLVASPEQAARVAAMERRMQEDMREEAGEMADWRPNLRVVGIDEEAAILPPLMLDVQGVDGRAVTLQVIGVVEQETTLAGNGVWVNQAVINRLAGEVVDPNEFYIKVRAGADVRAVAQATERAFLNNAVNATALAESFAQAQTLVRGILQLFQGFMALGLLVGIAALGVIATRTVVERRQQVGMLRAIGFQPRMVALAFLIESSFIALTGIAVGAGVGISLGQSLVTQSYAELSGGRYFAIPWGEIGVIVLVAYGFALLTTLLPALQASRIYPAEALRYE